MAQQIPSCSSIASFLNGTNVIELAGLAPVPFCGLLLADFGAKVTLVSNRSSKSLANFEQRLCRGKQKLALDFTCKNDLNQLRALCHTADVLLDPYRPGTLERIGLEPDKLIQKNPGLIIARLTGYGQRGPLAAKAGHDINYVALSGLLPTISGKIQPGRRPWPPANLLADFAGGSLLSAFAIAAALYRRTQNGGHGCLLDCALTEGLAYLGTFVNMHRDLRWMWDDEFGIFSGNFPFYRTFETADGKWMAVGALEPKFQDELLKTLCFKEIPGEELGELSARLEKVFRSKGQKEWIEIFKDSDACVTPVLGIADQSFGEFDQHKFRGTFYKTAENADGTFCWVPRPAPITMELEGKEKSKL